MVALSRREAILRSLLSVLAVSNARAARASSHSPTTPHLQHITIQETESHFPHYWKACVGSGRAAQALRAEWISDLKFVHQNCGFESVRFHGLLNEELGLCRQNCDGTHNLNFLYIDKIFDTILDIGMKPFVELSFMPPALKSGDQSLLWYKANTTPPRQIAEWHALIKNLITHLLERYGEQEISSWQFEVWNEPNINFWSGTQSQYFLLFEETYRAIKSVKPDLSVGGPATAQMGWISDFLDFCHSRNITPDFLSSHIYDHDPQEKVFDRPEHIPYSDVIPTAIEYVRKKIKRSPYPSVPFYITEWTSQNPAYILKMICECSGKINLFSYWTFDSLIEESGPVEGYGKSYFGLLDQGSVPRPSYHAFYFLNHLTQTRLETDDPSLIVTKDNHGHLIALVWNYNETHPSVMNYRISCDDHYSRAHITLYNPHNDRAFILWNKMGSPLSPTQEQYQSLKESSMIYDHYDVHIHNGVIYLSLPPDSIACIKIQ